MDLFTPKRVFIEPAALDYPLGRELKIRFQKAGIPVQMTGSHNRVTGIPGRTPQESYLEGKQTLAVGVRRTLNFESCKPSAHYQLPLATSCAGRCEYCYLNTTLGKKPYLRVYVNVEEILAQAKKYIEERRPEVTFFEGAATSDPLPVEPYTGSLRRAIEFFAGEELGRFRFVTKFANVETLDGVTHNGHTTVRFSLNTGTVIHRYEHNTPGLRERIGAAARVAEMGFPLGFLIAPVLIYPSWREDYRQLFAELSSALVGAGVKQVGFEIITHRFTTRAKNNIREIFPNTSLPMAEEDRQYKYGQFGYGKYVYPPQQMREIRECFGQLVQEFFPAGRMIYLV